MTGLGFSQIAKALSGRLIGPDGEMQSVSTDTRQIVAGDLFIALQGENFDAHQFIDQAVDSGAAAVMVNKTVTTKLPQIVVSDTKIGLGKLAQLWRQQFQLPVIGVTGSNGKTTVKEMLGVILGRLGDTLLTEGNLNNEIGVPLTLLRLREWHRYAVVEMGANHPGEIRYLTNLVQPQVALINNAAPAHLEGFGSIEGVARAKAEIYESLKPQDHAIINADDAYAGFWREKTKHCRRVEFGLQAHTDVQGAWNRQANTLHVKTLTSEATVQLPLPGEHNARNALAAIATTMAVGASLDEICQGLEAMQPVAGRLVPYAGVNGVHILDDTYNANPASIEAGLNVLCGMPGEAWLILGDMAELGPGTEQLHAQVGVLAKKLGVARLFAIGKASVAAVDEFGDGATFYNEMPSLIEAVVTASIAGVNILVKGSRTMHMEQVVAELVNKSETGDGLRLVRSH